MITTQRTVRFESGLIFRLLDGRGYPLILSAWLAIEESRFFPKPDHAAAEDFLTKTAHSLSKAEFSLLAQNPEYYVSISLWVVAGFSADSAGGGDGKIVWKMVVSFFN